MLERSQNGCVEFGTVSYRGKPWWLGYNSRYVWACHRPWLVKFNNFTPRTLTLKSAVDDAGFVGVADRMPVSVLYSSPLQSTCKLFPQVVWLQVFQS